jgi:hypothetical protein
VAARAVTRPSLRGALAAGLRYFACVFAAGFALGVFRTLVLLPRMGAVPAVLIELPVILAAAWLICRHLLRQFPLEIRGAAAMGLVAFVLLMLAEAGISLLLAGRTLAGHLALYAQAAHQLGLAGQVAFALFPLAQAWLARRDRR